MAAVLLLVAGELPAFDMLCRLATGHLRDATRPSLDPVIELLGLMQLIVREADGELAAFLEEQGLPPFYSLSWYITWFSHDLSQFGEVRGVRRCASGSCEWTIWGRECVQKCSTSMQLPHACTRGAG